MTDFAEVASDPASIDIAESVVDTALKMALPASGFTKVPFEISGMLTRVDTSGGIAAQTIQLQEFDGNVFADVANMTAVTADDGSFSMEMVEDAAGTYEFRVVYLGGSA